MSMMDKIALSLGYVPLARLQEMRQERDLALQLMAQDEDAPSGFKVDGEPVARGPMSVDDEALSRTMADYVGKAFEDKTGALTVGYGMPSPVERETVPYTGSDAVDVAEIARRYVSGENRVHIERMVYAVPQDAAGKAYAEAVRLDWMKSREAMLEYERSTLWEGMKLHYPDLRALDVHAVFLTPSMLFADEGKRVAWFWCKGAYSTETHILPTTMQVLAMPITLARYEAITNAAVDLRTEQPISFLNNELGEAWKGDPAKAAAERLSRFAGEPKPIRACTPTRDRRGRFQRRED